MELGHLRYALPVVVIRKDTLFGAEPLQLVATNVVEPSYFDVVGMRQFELWKIYSSKASTSASVASFALAEWYARLQIITPGSPCGSNQDSDRAN
ncbi:hypothetical protein [Bradyrhizobium sp. 6(2017)]|uniref:hypothetical protein n=1 Tax=Bradyrhizobium sp. 6(2017) TaxID=1197460 RepID=UPI0013E1C48D|nr:hypothetical protein [Bradyrhizobium sp. 6(2017)]QIG94247.1 hypothetical protein G6P99_18385 [Bradyrhizobium sp. 6(2017)]